MNAIERIKMALLHKQTEYTPVFPILSGITRKLNNSSYYDWATNAEICADALIKAQEKFDLDCILTLTDLSVEASDFGQELIYPENEAAYPNANNYLLKSIEDFDKLEKIDPRITPRMSEHIKLCNILVDKKGQEVPIIAFIFGPLGILSMLRGQENLYMDLYDCPEKVKAAVELITEVLIDYCKEIMQTGVHAIMIDTLFASQSIMSKEMWLEFEGQYVTKIADFVHNNNCMFMIHNCGNGIYFDAQIQTMKPEAISFLHVPDDCKDFADTKQKYGSQTTLIGTIDPTWLVNASQEEVINECKKQIDIFGKNGGYILATGCEYPANFSFDHAQTICDVARSYNPYKK